MNAIEEHPTYKTVWTLRKYADDQAFRRGAPYAVARIEGNLLLNEGIGEALDIIGGLGAPTLFDEANTRIGVGDSAVGESAAHTDLQAGANKFYQAVEAAYPQRAAQTITWRSVFAGADANFAWNEFTIANGSSGAAKNLNRKVSAQGTKANGQTWTLDVSITLS